MTKNDNKNDEKSTDNIEYYKKKVLDNGLIISVEPYDGPSRGDWELRSKKANNMIFEGKHKKAKEILEKLLDDCNTEGFKHDDLKALVESNISACNQYIDFLEQKRVESWERVEQARTDGKYDKALKLIEKYLKISKSLEDDDDHCGTFISMAEVHLSKKNIDAAIECYQLAIDFAQSADDKMWEAIAREHLGNLYLGLKNPYAALGQYKIAERLYEVIKYDQGVAGIKVYQGVAWIFLDNWEAADSLFSESKKEAPGLWSNEFNPEELEWDEEKLYTVDSSGNKVYGDELDEEEIL